MDGNGYDDRQSPYDFGAEMEFGTNSDDDHDGVKALAPLVGDGDASGHCQSLCSASGRWDAG